MTIADAESIARRTRNRMLYLGGKGRNGRAIANAILSRTTRRARLIEPFIGGANVTKSLAPEFQDVWVGDTHEDLILMWRAAARGWSPPSSVTEKEYAEARLAAPSALRGFIGFGCSYGGKWWGGYARPRGDRPCRTHPDYYAQLASRDVQEVGCVLTRATIVQRPYDEWDVTSTASSTPTLLTPARLGTDVASSIPSASGASPHCGRTWVPMCSCRSTTHRTGGYRYGPSARPGRCRAARVHDDRAAFRSSGTLVNRCAERRRRP